MFKINPYRPGAGLMPIYLAGRDDDLENIDSLFMAMTYNIPVQSVIFSGLRGVGKTVLINSLQKKAEEKNIFCRTAESSLICLQRKTGWNRSMRMFTRIHFWESIWQRKWQSAALSSK